MGQRHALLPTPGEPRSPEGKARSCMNAVAHDLRAKPSFCQTKDEKILTRFTTAFRNNTTLKTPPKQSLVDAAVIAQWKMVRAEVYDTAAYDEDQSDIARAEFFRGMIRAQNSLPPLL